MDISRISSATKSGYSYQIFLNAIQEPSLSAIATLIETLQQLSQTTYSSASVRLPEYLDPEAAQRLAEFLHEKLDNARVWITVDENPFPSYALHPALEPFRNGKTQRDLKEDYLLKQRQIKGLRQQISEIHYTIPGFRANDSYHRSPISPDLKIGDCSPQELWAALMLNSGFNSFDPYEVVSDLYAHRHLWQGFAMLPDIEVITSQRYPDLQRRGFVRFLPMLEYRHHCDCLYIAAADDEAVFQLVDFGKVWQADDVQVYTGDEAERLLDQHL
jgi:hypothetical protein